MDLPGNSYANGYGQQCHQRTPYDELGPQRIQFLIGECDGNRCPQHSRNISVRACKWTAAYIMRLLRVSL